MSGNLKFDVAPEPAQLATGHAWREHLGRPVLLLASTREGEEQMLLDALPPWDGKLLVLVVPRHPPRFDEVARLAQSRRSSDRLARDRPDLDRMLAEIRKRGYSITGEATRRITWNVSRRAMEGRKRVTGLGVPILADNRVLGALSLRYSRTSLSDSEAARLYLEPMRNLAKEIADDVKSRQAG